MLQNKLIKNVYVGVFFIFSIIIYAKGYDNDSKLISLKVNSKELEGDYYQKNYPFKDQNRLSLVDSTFVLESLGGGCLYHNEVFMKGNYYFKDDLVFFEVNFCLYKSESEDWREIVINSKEFLGLLQDSYLRDKFLFFKKFKENIFLCNTIFMENLKIGDKILSTDDQIVNTNNQEKAGVGVLLKTE